MSNHLSFPVLRRMNKARQGEWPGNDQADVAFRAIEVAGEAGEVAEAVKKYLRAKRGIMGTTMSVQDIADELGDLVIAADLLAEKLGIGIDLGEATCATFNRTSEKYGLATRLPTAPQSVGEGKE